MISISGVSSLANNYYISVLFCRSLLLRSMSDHSKRMCATILPPLTESAQAEFVYSEESRVEGEIMWTTNSQTGEVQVWINLYDNVYTCIHCL